MKRTPLRSPQGLKAGSLKRKTAMARGSTPSGSASGLRRRQPDREWGEARAKVEEEGTCRACGTTRDLQAAHVIGRERDQFIPFAMDKNRVGEQWDQPWLVYPDRIVPLCGHFGNDCHGMYDCGEIDLAGKLTLREELQAVADSYTRGTNESGVENMRVRTAPSCYRPRPGGETE